MLAGAVGLFAVFKSNALSAKIYLWTWLPKFFVGVVARYTLRAEMKQYGIDKSDGPGVVISELLSVVFLLYYVKVGRSQRTWAIIAVSFAGEAKWGRRPSVVSRMFLGTPIDIFSWGSLLVGGCLQDHVDVVVD
ncbi:unnamed protein product [Ectocarpus sp. 12 AP-2014]